MNEINNDNNKEFEILFWKVFHNKYIRTIIFNLISEVEWVQLDCYEHYNGENKKKFKNIKSLHWMVLNDQYQLLKCKIESPQEHIGISQKGIELLINQIDTENQWFNIFQLLLNYKSLELSKFNLIYIITNKENQNSFDEEMVQLILDTYKDTIHSQITEWVLENVIVKSNTTILNMLLSYLTSITNFEIPNKIKNQSIKMAFKNKNNIEPMVNYILNNSNLYNSGGCSNSDNQIDISISITTSRGFDSTLNQLLDLNYIKFSSKYSIYSSDLQETVANCLDNSNNENIFKNNRIKEIYQLLSTESHFNIYKKYLIKYNFEPIESIDQLPFIYNLFYLFNSSILNQLIQSGSEWFKGNFKFKFQEDSFKIGRLDQQFIQFYISNYSILKDPSIDNCISKYLNQPSPTTCDTLSTEYESILYNFKNSIGYIKNIEIVEWLINNFDKYTIQKKFKFDNLKLYEYCLTIFKTVSNKFQHDQEYIVSNLFIKALDNCDIEEIKLICQGYSDNLKNIQIGKNIDQDEHVNYKEIKPFLNHLFDIKYSIFAPITFKQYIVRLCSNCNVELLDDVKIDFYQFQQVSASLYQESITVSLSSNVIKLMFNNGFNPGTLPTHYQSNNCLFQSKIDGGISFCYSNESPIEIIEIVKLLLQNQFKQGTGSIIPIINQFYKRLIKIKNVTIDQVLQFRQLVFNVLGNTFQFEHTLFHVLYYIGIKSLKLIKFIMGIPSMIDHFRLNDSSFSYELRDSDIYDTNFNQYYIIEKYLNPMEFTFDHLFGSGSGNGSIGNGISFNCLLESLILNLIHLPAINDSNAVGISFYTESLNYTLSFLLQFNMVQLFFSELDQIEKRIQSNGQPVFKYSYSLFINASNKLDPVEFERFIKYNSYNSVKDILLLQHINTDSVALKIGHLLKHFHTIYNTVVQQFGIVDYWNTVVFKLPKVRICGNFNSGNNFGQFKISSKIIIKYTIDNVKLIKETNFKSFPFDSLLKSILLSTNSNTPSLPPFIYHLNDIYFKEFILKLYK